MELNVLLVNPWIYDFAAYNLWSRPLGLLKVAEYLSAYKIRLHYIDCAGACRERRYGAGRIRSERVTKPAVLQQMRRYFKRYGIRIDDFVARLSKMPKPDVVMMTSIMSYWYPGVRKAVEVIRERWGDVVIILGGIYATLYHEHASLTSGADYIYRGPVHRGLDCALRTFSFRVARKREPLRYYDLGLTEGDSFAPLLTSVGCPFRCSYCASDILAGKEERRDPGDVLDEIRVLSGRGVHDFAFYDDALLADADHHLKPLLRSVAVCGRGVRFHAPNGLHARYLDEETATLMKLTNFRTLRLSLETVDTRRQQRTGGKVTSGDIDRATGHLKKAGFPGRDIGVYLMYGLPRQELAEVQEGIRFLRALGVRILLTEFSPIRGTACWNDLIADGVIDDDIDPLLTNNTVFSCLYSSYDQGRVTEMKGEVKAYNAGL